LANPADPTPLGGEGKFVEADETYVGGREHANRRADECVRG